MTHTANIVPSLARALEIKGYEELTEVQSAVLQRKLTDNLEI